MSYILNTLIGCDPSRTLCIDLLQGMWSRGGEKVEGQCCVRALPVDQVDRGDSEEGWETDVW